MSRIVDMATLDLRYRKRLQFEIAKKVKLRAPSNLIFVCRQKRIQVDELPALKCECCGRQVRVGSRIHVQRGPMRVRIYHQACWNKQFIF